MESIRGRMQYEKNYKRSVSQMNQLIQVYQREAVEMLNQLENAEREQIKLQSDGIRKLIVSEVSMFKNVEYDLINISKQMEKMYAQNDVQQFKKQAINLNSEEDYLKDMSLKAVDFDRSLLALSLKNVEEDYYPWLLSIKKNKIMRKIMELRIKDLNQTEGQSVVSIQQKPVLAEKIINQNKQGNQMNDNKEVENKQLQPKSEEKVQNTNENGGIALTKQKQSKGSQSTNTEKKSGQFDGVILQTVPQKKVSDIKTEWQNLPPDLFNPPPNPNGAYQKFNSQQSYQDFIQLSQIINKVWIKGQKMDGQSRKKFITLLEKNHFLRVLAYLFIEEYRIQHRVLMSWDNYQKSSELTKILIDVCEKFGDVFTLKGLLALIFTFYSIKDEKFKKLLYQSNYASDCAVWKRQDYWEASIFQSTYQQMVNFNVQKGETPSQTLLRQKNIIFSQLASYCHYMLMLGTSSKSVRRIVGRYCRLYEMTEDQNKDLSKMISNTTKQLKQTNVQSPTLQNNTSTGTVSVSDVAQTASNPGNEPIP